MGFENGFYCSKFFDEEQGIHNLTVIHLCNHTYMKQNSVPPVLTAEGLLLYEKFKSFKAAAFLIIIPTIKSGFLLQAFRTFLHLSQLLL